MFILYRSRVDTKFHVCFIHTNTHTLLLPLLLQSLLFFSFAFSLYCLYRSFLVRFSITIFFIIWQLLHNPIHRDAFFTLLLLLLLLFANCWYWWWWWWWWCYCCCHIVIHSFVHLLIQLATFKIFISTFCNSVVRARTHVC